jgi:hypothetical protein
MLNMLRMLLIRVDIECCEAHSEAQFGLYVDFPTSPNLHVEGTKRPEDGLYGIRLENRNRFAGFRSCLRRKLLAAVAFGLVCPGFLMSAVKVSAVKEVDRTRLPLLRNTL